MTESEDALRAALEAAGLSLQAIPEEQRAMFTSLSDDEVSRLITLCAGQTGAGGGTGGTGSDPVPPGSSDPAGSAIPAGSAVPAGSAPPAEPAGAAVPSDAPVSSGKDEPDTLDRRGGG